MDNIKFAGVKSFSEIKYKAGTVFRKLLKQFLIWRIRHVSDRVFIVVLAVLVGVMAGFVAVIIKSSVHLIQGLLKDWFSADSENLLFIFYPVIGILLVLIFVNYIIKRKVGHGIPTVLFSISKTKGKISPHNMYSSIITSALTVGFGGSVGLEGPTVATGAAYGSNVGHLFHLNYKQILLLLGCACTAAMAAIFKAPVAAIVFALEVIMLDLTMVSLVPLLLASVSAVLISYLFMGQNVLYPVNITEGFDISSLFFYIIIGILAGFLSVYFTKMYMFINRMFDKIHSWSLKLITGGFILGLLIFLMPVLYGEGYEAINAALHGETQHVFNNTFYYQYQGEWAVIIIIFLAVLFFKVIATSVTFASGGVGGVFAPSLFLGANLGLMFSLIVNGLGWDISAINFALVGMAGAIAGIIHAPLTAIFLIAETTGGYELFVPLMIVSAISYATVKVFTPNSVYTIQLAKRGQLRTHHKDKAMLSMMNIESLIETNFKKLYEEDMLGDLVKQIEKSSRNVFPVLNDTHELKGIVVLENIREIMFKSELYDKVSVKDIMISPEPYLVTVHDNMEKVAEKFQQTGNFNLPVVDGNKYLGFVSRAKVFSEYRRLIKRFSDD
ncbi:MAG: chloride channel protein [Bacteroidota bacterium]|nr:chloride channel protein [Bacteroidota bacterium]